MQIVDSVERSGQRFDDWSFGGGTVLMRRFRHRVSKDVDIFVPDPQYLGYVSPRLNDTAAKRSSTRRSRPRGDRKTGRACNRVCRGEGDASVEEKPQRLRRLSAPATRADSAGVMRSAFSNPATRSSL